jgi:hypothetical protein
VRLEKAASGPTQVEVAEHAAKRSKPEHAPWVAKNLFPSRFGKQCKTGRSESPDAKSVTLKGAQTMCFVRAQPSTLSIGAFMDTHKKHMHQNKKFPHVARMPATPTRGVIGGQMISRGRPCLDTCTNHLYSEVARAFPMQLL